MERSTLVKIGAGFVVVRLLQKASEEAGRRTYRTIKKKMTERRAKRAATNTQA